MRYLVRYDFTKYQPKWSAAYARTFGERNEGFTLLATDLEDAREHLRRRYNLNPFYLTIEESPIIAPTFKPAAP